jgi:all-trans-retinol 13,14-reductase
MKRTGRRYRTARADKHYDVIVIGSGIGGLTNAALLSKLGKKVCVLEQHYTAGGFTHTYENGGYEWDVGVHYIGDVHKPHSPLRRIFDVISNGQLKWSPMDDCYDRIIIDDRRYDFRVGREAFKSDLKERFPEEAKAIDDYVHIVDRCSQSMSKFFLGQATSPTIAKIHRSIRPFLVPKEATMTVRDVLEGLTSNQELIGVLTGQWGDYGMVPADATFLMHASVAKHYFSGGNYPVGGSWKMADTIIPVIQASGGEVFTYAKVDEIVVEKGRACGVRMENGDVLRADKIVSSVGARLTYGKLLPESERKKHNYEAKLETVKASGASLCLFMGFKGDAAELQLPKTNLWIYPSPNHEDNVERFAEDQDADFPLLYVSFPSAKDPEWAEHYPGKSTVQVITMAPYAWFEKWSGTTWKQRGEDYEAIKEKFTQRMLEALYKQMPQLEGALDFYELATPLSTEWFHLYDRGEIYGLDHNPGRFEQDWLHPVSPVKGLYMTGQDVVTAGVGGALIAGLLTTGAMVGFREFGKVQKMLKEWQPDNT